MGITAFQHHVTGQQALAAMAQHTSSSCMRAVSSPGVFPLLEKSIFFSPEFGRIQFLIFQNKKLLAQNAGTRPARFTGVCLHVLAALFSSFFFLLSPPLCVLCMCWGEKGLFTASLLLRKAHIPALPDPTGYLRRSLPGHRFPLPEVVFRQ